MLINTCCVLPRSLTQPSLLLLEADDNSVGIGAGHRRRSSFSYFRLPEQLIRLSILKLDGSSFDVQVPRNACVWELKATIEGIFSQSSKEKGCDISWSHVWSHFCLCHNDHKLVDDKESLKTLGIKDGDQLPFIRHLSLSYRPTKRRSRSLASDLELHNISLAGSKVIEKAEEINKDGEGNHFTSSQYVAEDNSKCNQGDDLVQQKEFKLGHIFRGWFSYSRLKTSRKGKPKSQNHLKFVFNRKKISSKKMSGNEVNPSC